MINKLQNMCYCFCLLAFRYCRHPFDFLREVGVFYEIWSVLCWFICEVVNRELWFEKKKRKKKKRLVVDSKRERSEFVFSPTITLCGWLGPSHQLTRSLTHSLTRTLLWTCSLYESKRLAAATLSTIASRRDWENVHQCFKSKIDFIPAA